METQSQKNARIMTNINWFVFGAVFLSIGMFVITGLAGWAWVAFVSLFLFGLSTGAVLGAKSIVAREIT